jgi:hypothetical protein
LEKDPPVEIVEQEWPPLFRSLVKAAGLAFEQRASVSVLFHQEFIDHSCVLRMPATEAAIAFLAEELPKTEEAALHPSFWQHGVCREEFGSSEKLTFYATPDRAVNVGEGYVAIHDREKKRIVVCFRQVF